MPDASSIADAPSAADPERAARLMAAADRLVEIGMELVQALHRDVTEGRLTALKAAAPFERLSRAVRLTIVLAQRLEAGIDIPVQAGAAADASGSDAASAGLETEPAETFERERGERGEYRERGDLDESVWLTRPIPVLAARICTDLGVPYDAALWGDGGGDFGAGGQSLGTLPPRWGKGRDGGVSAELGREALSGAGADLGRAIQRPANTPNPPLPPSRGKDAFLSSAVESRPP